MACRQTSFGSSLVHRSSLFFPKKNWHTNLRENRESKRNFVCWWCSLLRAIQAWLPCAANCEQVRVLLPFAAQRMRILGNFNQTMLHHETHDQSAEFIFKMLQGFFKPNPAPEAPVTRPQYQYSSVGTRRMRMPEAAQNFGSPSVACSHLPSPQGLTLVTRPTLRERTRAPQWRTRHRRLLFTGPHRLTSTPPVDSPAPSPPRTRSRPKANSNLPAARRGLCFRNAGLRRGGGRAPGAERLSRPPPPLPAAGADCVPEAR